LLKQVTKKINAKKEDTTLNFDQSGIDDDYIKKPFPPIEQSIIKNNSQISIRDEGEGITKQGTFSKRLNSMKSLELSKLNQDYLGFTKRVR
jgi:hypothetical protein